MYRRPKFLEILLDLRQRMSREADYDVDLFAEMIRADRFSKREEEVTDEIKDERNEDSEEAKDDLDAET